MPIDPKSPGPASVRHVRWLAGGTGAGKTEVARVLTGRYDVDRYDGDLAEHDWLTRATSARHPRFAALRDPDSSNRGPDTDPEQIVESMGGWHGETMDFLVEDMLARPTQRVTLVDYFGFLPEHVAPLLSWPEQAVFLLPTARFRREALTRRYADPHRARANWGDRDPASMLESRLARDAFWDARVREQALDLGLRVIEIDGTRGVERIAADVAKYFRLPG